jgi:excisionase family DNA binding protein
MSGAPTEGSWRLVNDIWQRYVGGSETGTNQMAALKVSGTIESFIVADKAVEPSIPQGARLLCSSKIAPKSGDFVVFSPNDGSPHFVRQYAVQQDGSILLHAPNRDFDSYVSSSAELEASGRLLPILKMEREFPACERAGGLPAPAQAAPSTPVQPQPAAPSAEAANQQLAESSLLTFDEAKAALKVRRTKMYALLRSGDLKASKVGKLWRIERASIQQYLSNAAFKGGGGL